jgi:predicted DNA-binding transcriptional regulator AlpA
MTIHISKCLPDVLGQERVLSAQQAAELFGVSVATFRRQYWAGKLPPALRVSDRRLGWRVRDLTDHLKKTGEVAA